jgi:5-methylcytosine-specific restriction enzyme MrcB-like protein/uncharacterized protein DUF3883
MQSQLEAVLRLQPSWVAAAPSDAMTRRGVYVTRSIADFIRERRQEIADRLHCGLEDVLIQGKNSMGSYSRVPWTRVADLRYSPDPREGWYAVYLFAEDGREASLSLNQGTQLWDGVGLRPRPESSIRRRTTWARRQLEDEIIRRPRLATNVYLGTSQKSRSYEAGVVVGYTYARGSVPDDAVLATDLLDIASLLGLLYAAETRSPVPGEPDLEIIEAELVGQKVAGRRTVSRTGFRMNQKQRKAVELRAMRLAIEHFDSIGAVVNDVSANQSYDLEVRQEGARWDVEVKGTVSDGVEILVTHPEVVHQRCAYPNNALVVVSGIRLEGPADAPVAVGGELRLIQPWCVDDGSLTPISYRCAPPPSTVPSWQSAREEATGEVGA